MREREAGREWERRRERSADYSYKQTEIDRGAVGMCGEGRHGGMNWASM